MKYLSYIVTVAMVLAVGCSDLDQKAPTLAQDPTKVDSTRYKVAFENEQVRVLRISYGPGEKSVMHEHPESVVVFLSDGHGKFTDPEGSIEEISWKAGEVVWFPAVKHLPENMSDKGFEVIQIEIKSKDK